MCAPCDLKGQKGVLKPLELELQMLVGCLMVLGMEEQPVLTDEPSLQPLLFLSYFISQNKS